MGAVVSDPQFTDPGQVCFEVDMRDPERLSGCRLQGNSPCIDAGIMIDNNGGKDFLGTPLESAFIDIGAFESITTNKYNR